MYQEAKRRTLAMQGVQGLSLSGGMRSDIQILQPAEVVQRLDLQRRPQPVHFTGGMHSTVSPDRIPLSPD